jgi:iron(III) transport system ATP-binding protein
MASALPVTISDLTVRYGAVAAVDGVSLRIEAGEVFLLLGPSGCGKTTLLRAIAGFVEADAGTIHFAGDDVTRVPPHARNAGMVFQSFALWPHLSVFENVAFGLRERRVAKGEITERVEAALASTRLPGYGGRRVDELSGGEQQRVALARALVVRPRCLLLDEPLSNLDARLRHSMREEIRRLCKEHGLTTVYVTHDQKEALAVADRIGVMSKGRLLQVGLPAEVYRRPRSRAVASFLGETNLWRGRVLESTAAEVRVSSPVGPLVAAPEEQRFEKGADVWISVRPECVRLVHDGEAPAPNTLRGRRDRVTYLGEIAERRLRVGEVEVALYELNPHPDFHEEHAVQIAPEDVVLLPADEGEGAA